MLGIAGGLDGLISAFDRLDIAALELRRRRGFSGMGLAGLGGAVLRVVNEDVGADDVDVASGRQDAAAGEGVITRGH